ncbi:t-SNARE [Viridothelium virens]|uniref:t-SNARE n=1 Tax=Viridothelium virens TaxID=1048519 RepID=A0A6A6HIS7_VIRVR|nr:t-SNARE [Viridothelium virens]
MAYNQYARYSGNPYEGEGGGEGYGQSNPYGSNTGGGYGASNPYGHDSYGEQPAQGLQAPPRLQHHEASNYSQGSNYSTPTPQAGYQQGYAQAPDGAVQRPPGGAPTIMSTPDFLTRVKAVNSDIDSLTGHISQIGSVHQRLLSSPESQGSSQLEHLVSQTQILNTQIKDNIKRLEEDAARSGNNDTKNSQIRTLKNNFKRQLEEYQKEEQVYRQRYQDQIERQYRIVNPEATDEEAKEAAQANWGDEGVFQTALKSNRTGAATSVLGAVRARHNDIQQIEKTLYELNSLFEQLAEQVILQEPAVKSTEEGTQNVLQDTENANVQLDKGIKSARRARRLKWITLGIVVLIIVILALVLGLYFGLKNNGNKNNGS